MTVGERIKKRRKELDISADQLAAALGVHRTTIFRYEKGEIEKFPGDALVPIAEALHTTPAYLMGWEKDPAPAEEPPVTSTRLGAITVAFSQLNDEGQEKVIDYAHDLINTGCYSPSAEAKHA